MTTRKRQPPTSEEKSSSGNTYRELAQSSASIERRLSGEALPRLAELGKVHEVVEATFRFLLHDGRAAVAARASAVIDLPCQWCDQSRQRTLDAEFEALLAEDEAQAQAWSADADEDAPVIVVAGRHFDAAALIEDELLLAVPGRVCDRDVCEFRPDAEYGDGEVPEAPKPLAGLRALLDEVKSEK